MTINQRIIRKIKWIRAKQLRSKIFQQQFHQFAINKERDFRIDWADAKAYYNDNTAQTEFDAHYIYHPAWAARIIKQIAPAYHVDISSTLHFCSILSAFIPVRFYDYRPAALTLDNLTSGKGDLTKLFFDDNSIHSISCMHTIEHIGLGRYGDTIDSNGDIKAIEELKRVVMPGGSLLIVLPVGKPKVVFNAHRIYRASDVTNLFAGFDLREFSLIKDNNEFVNNALLQMADAEEYGCGCFWFVKKI